MTKVSAEARALTSLLMLCGEASDLIASIKRNPADPRRDYLDRLESLANEMWDHINRRDITAAASIAFDLERAKFEVNARELAPFVRTGRKQHAALKQRRDMANAAVQAERSAAWAWWNKEAAPLWKTLKTKNAVARSLKKRLKLEEDEVSTIAKRLKKPRQAS